MYCSSQKHWLNRPHIDPSEPLMKYEELGGGGGVFMNFWSIVQYDVYVFGTLKIKTKTCHPSNRTTIICCMVCQDTDFKICLCSNSTNSTLFIVHLLGTNKTGELVNVTPGDLGLRQISTFSGFPKCKICRDFYFYGKCEQLSFYPETMCRPMSSSVSC